MPRTPTNEYADMVQFTLRLPKDVSDWIREQAKKDHRSANSEIIHIFRQAMERSTNVANDLAEPADPKEATLSAAGSVTNSIGITAATDPGEPKNSL